MIDVAFIILFALIGNYLFSKLGLPGLLGMIVTGLILGPSGFDLIDAEIQALLKEFKTVALIVILIRAGLGISKETLHRIGGPAIRMSFIPGAIEGLTVMLISYWLLDLQLYEAGMLGFIIAAVSPAVVVPTMLQLKEAGFGKNKEVPTLVLAGASLDDVFAITIFSVFAGLAAGDATNWTYLVLGVPGGILLGAAIGAIIGFAFTWFFKKYHLRDTMKVIIFMIVSVIFYEVAEMPPVKNIVPIAALLGIMAIGFVLLEKYDILANRMAMKFNKIWVFAEILLFVYIGSEVRIADINTSLVGVGVLILGVGLISRSIGVYLSLLRSELNRKEKLFCVIAYWPKATVQAAMGAVPLTMVMSGQIKSMSEQTGHLILTMAVLSIVLTAPLGAIGIKLGGPKLLSRED
jgi:NhaP-type Na+/H+ or K+/H+ antiporter